MKRESAVLGVILGLASASLMAAEQSPKTIFYGQLGLSAGWQDGQDFDVGAYDARFGLKGLIDLGDIKVKYVGEVQHVTAAKHTDGELLEIREAKAVVISDFGMLALAGAGESNTYADLYAPVDIQEINSGTPHSHDGLFQQSQFAKSILAYITPQWHGLQLKTAVITLTNDTGSDSDVLRLGAVYRKSGLKIAANVLKTSEQHLGREQDYFRYAFMGEYRWGKVTLASLVEVNQDSPVGDSTVYAAAAKYFVGNWEYRLSQQYKDWQGDYDNQSISAAAVHYHFSPHFSVFTEGALYSKPVINKSGYTSDSNLNFGMMIRF
ncbi:porin [Shewanella sp. NIFS-20-20]|uniref:porin n=1 Tax=Shewanella sp. NIFS-20-20 TaxID=2853806 RepID=UPI001C458716|nr:porin [Shewanella sp. NIFS-20-20]MBV7317603.1 porin [Shewanella sp. NIFS-20-20]